MSIEIITIKEGFGTEPKFTKYIADNTEVAEMLLEAVNISGGDFTIRAEDKTNDNKRVDNVVYDDSGKVICVIEAQDCTGWLDSVHASKINYYCWEKECFEAILITEDADEKMKSYVQWMNENTPLNIFIVAPIIVKIDDEVQVVKFIPIMRPLDYSQKKIKMKNTDSTGEDNREFFEEMKNKYPDLLPNACKSWAHSGAMFSKYYVSICKRNETFYTEVVYKRKGRGCNMKNEDDLFPFLKETFGKGFMPNKNKCYVKTNSFDEALGYYKPIIKAGKEKSINLGG